MTYDANPTPVNKPYKAIVGFVIAFVGALLATVQGRTDLDTMKLVDWLIVIATALVTAGGVYQTSNNAR